uniref:Uncharacterized protein n=1 Tax=Megaselia scalaris TaxID=36166 RepID=T1GQX9_MEGSC
KKCDFFSDRQLPEQGLPLWQQFDAQHSRSTFDDMTDKVSGTKIDGWFSIGSSSNSDKGGIEGIAGNAAERIL